MLAAPPHLQDALRLRGVAHEYLVRGEPTPVLTPTDLSVRAGEFVSLIGPSGCGKSTLLHIAGGLLEPSRGSVTVAGGAAAAARRAKQIGVVAQDPALLPWRTVAENVRLLTDVRRGGGRADESRLLAMVALDGFGGHYPHQLSGGMKQRAALARALALDPPLLLMDEPFGALDDLTRTELRHQLLAIRERLAAAVLFVTHSIDEAVLLSDRVVVMAGRPGRIVDEVAIDLPAPRTAVEDGEAFAAYVRRLRAALRGGGVQ